MLLCEVYCCTKFRVSIESHKHNIYNNNIICVPLFFNVVYKQVHCCHNSVLVFSLLSYTNMHIEVLMCIVCQQRWESVIYKVLLYQVSCVSVFPLVSYIHQRTYSHLFFVVV